MDSLHLLAVVSNLQAQDSSETLQGIAEKQQSQLNDKKKIRNVQECYDQFMKDGTMDATELSKLQSMCAEISVDASVSGVTYDSAGSIQTGDGADAAQRTNKTVLDAIGSGIKSKMDDATDNEAMLQFQIQIATSDMQNSESNRSQAEKKLSDHRNELRRNWGA